MKKTKKLSEEILHKIRHIKIVTRHVLNGMLVGDTRTAIKGSGFEFDQIREYQPGDDVRFIDWKASARTGSMLVKQYIEERNRTVYILLDISASGELSSAQHSKRDISAQVASVISLASFYGKDTVGALLFSDTVENFMPPSNELHHINKCIEDFFSFEARGKKTNINSAIEHLLQHKKKNALVFIVSDFIDEINDSMLSQLARKNDVVAVRCLDSIEKMFPPIGILHLQDIETGQEVVIDTKNKSLLQSFYAVRFESQNRLFKKYGISMLEVSPDTKHLAKKMVQFFAKRMSY